MPYSYDRRASESGPFGFIDETYVYIWLELDTYGRVHHVTGDLNQAEKNLQKVKDQLLATLREKKINYDWGDIYVDGLPGGRNRMTVHFYFNARPEKWTPEEQETIKDGLKLVSDWKSSLPRS